MARKIITKTCAFCQRPFTVTTQTPSRRFCSHPCSVKAKRQDPQERFWQKVNKTDGCWLWTANTNPRGYGKFSLNNKQWLAHRFIWQLLNGDIPPNRLVCHHCDNPPCVNPSHLFLGTNTDNMTDMRTKGRAAVGDKNGMNTQPHRRTRGENHWVRQNPDRWREIQKRRVY